MTVRPRRSALYLPASNDRAIAKARALPCDVVILDLEDSVAPEAKGVARDAAIATVREGGFGHRELVVRVNALSTEWGADDCAALRGAGVDAVLVPKADRGSDVVAYREWLGEVPVWAMVETARAVLRIEDLAAAAGLGALVVGTNDLAKELHARPGPDRGPFQPFLSQIVAAGRAFGLSILDGVFNAIDDQDGFERECAQGLAFGFDGKTLIHPSQIEPCHAVFNPTSDEIAWAHTVEAVFRSPDAAGRGVLRVEGKMVERLHLDQALRTLAIARAIGVDR